MEQVLLILHRKTNLAISALTNLSVQSEKSVFINHGESQAVLQKPEFLTHARERKLRHFANDRVTGPYPVLRHGRENNHHLRARFSKTAKESPTQHKGGPNRDGGAYSARFAPQQAPARPEQPHSLLPSRSPARSARGPVSEADI